MLERMRARRQRGMFAWQVIMGVAVLGIVIGWLATSFSVFIQSSNPNYALDLAERVATSKAERIRAVTMYDSSAVTALEATGTKTWTEQYTVAPNLTKTATITTTASASSIAVDVTVDTRTAHVSIPLSVQAQAPGATVQ